LKNVRASIDIGSNSVLLLLAEVSPFKEIAKLSEVTGLGRGLDKSGIFAEESMQETYQALKHYGEVCAKAGVSSCEIIATATEASRVAKNAPGFYQKIREELGINVQIITGKGEAALTTKGILFNTTFATDEVVVMDIGGASTELIRVNTKTYEIQRSISLSVGSVRATDWIKEDIFQNALSKLFQDYSIELDRYRTTVLHCVAGTLTSIGNMHLGNKEFVEDEVHGLVLKKEHVEALFRRCSQWSSDDFIKEFPFLGKRSAAMRGGLILTTHLLQRLNVSEVVISTYGLRYGSFLDGGVANEYLAQ
jgi:exopolyphosphatase/guanosine-5'-triphosphate,3'-diphosphate pyrophosphatase